MSPQQEHTRKTNWTPWALIAVTGLVAIVMLWTVGRKHKAQEILGIELVSSVDANDRPLPRVDAPPQTIESIRRSVDSSEPPRLPVQPSGSGHIYVFNEAGVPVAGAEIHRLDSAIAFRLLDYSHPISELGEPLCRTDDEGRANLKLSSRNDKFVAFHAGYQPGRFTYDGEAAKNVRVALSTSTGRDFRIVNKEGLGIWGARILIHAQDLGWGREHAEEFVEVGKTGPNGEFSASDRSSRCRTLIAAEGYSLMAVDLEGPIGPGKEMTIVLPKASSVQGTILGSRAKRKAFLFAERLSMPKQPILVVPVSAFGEFSLPALTDDIDWGLTPCTLEDGVPLALGQTVVIQPPTEDVLISIAGGLCLSLRTVDPDGELIAASVALSLRLNEFLAQPGGDTYSVSEDGVSHWRSLPFPTGKLGAAHPHELWVVADGFAAVSAGVHIIRPDGMIEMGDIMLTPVKPWKIRVQDAQSQEPILGAKVTFTPYSVMRAAQENSPWLQTGHTDESGRIELKVPVDVAGILDVRLDGWSLYTTPVMEGAAKDTIIGLERHGSVVLRCVSLGGDPVPHASVQWSSPSGLNPSGRRWQAATVDADGMGRIDCPPGDIQIRHAPTMILGTAKGRSIRIDLKKGGELGVVESDPIDIVGMSPGETREVTIRLRVGSAVDVIVRRDGQPVPGVKVVGIPGAELDVVLNDLWGVFDFPRGITDEEGSCTLMGIPLGVVTVACIAPETRIATFQVIRMSNVLDVPIVVEDRSRRVEISTLDRDGQPLAGIRVRLEQLTIQHGARLPGIASVSPGGQKHVKRNPLRAVEGVTDQSGRTTFHDVSARARFRATCLAPLDFPLMSSARIEPGQIDEAVRLQDGLGSAIELELVNPQGQPIDSSSALLRWTDGFGRKHKRIGYSDEDGLLAFPLLDPGNYSVNFPSGQVVGIDLDPGESHHEVVVPR